MRVSSTFAEPSLCVWHCFVGFPLLVNRVLGGQSYSDPYFEDTDTKFHHSVITQPENGTTQGLGFEMVTALCIVWVLL